MCPVRHSVASANPPRLEISSGIYPLVKGDASYRRSCIYSITQPNESGALCMMNTRLTRPFWEIPASAKCFWCSRPQNGPQGRCQAIPYFVNFDKNWHRPLGTLLEGIFDGCTFPSCLAALRAKLEEPSSWKYFLGFCSGPACPQSRPGGSRRNTQTSPRNACLGGFSAARSPR